MLGVNEMLVYGYILMGGSVGLVISFLNVVMVLLVNGVSVYWMLSVIMLMVVESFGVIGGGQVYENCQFYLVLIFCIVLQGIFLLCS